MSPRPKAGFKAKLGKDQHGNLGAMINVYDPSSHEKTKMLLHGVALEGFINDLRLIQEQVANMKKPA